MKYIVWKDARGASTLDRFLECVTPVDGNVFDDGQVLIWEDNGEQCCADRADTIGVYSESRMAEALEEYALMASQQAMERRLYRDECRGYLA